MMKEETGEIPLTVLLSSLEHLVVLVHRPQASLKMAFQRRLKIAFAGQRQCFTKASPKMTFNDR
jgi:hypothetical protein